MGVACEGAPNRRSGARYQSVTTSWEYVVIGRPKERASPKSAIFSSPL